MDGQRSGGLPADDANDVCGSDALSTSSHLQLYVCFGEDQATHLFVFDQLIPLGMEERRQYDRKAARRAPYFSKR